MIDEAGNRIYHLAEEIFPICRSITGEGVRKTLKILSGYIFEGTALQIKIHNIPSGTMVYDWMVPKEWIISDAYIEDEGHRHIIDFKDNNLHVIGYSCPVDKWVELDELKEHIQTLPAQPEWIPYVTSYYRETYGFCMSENQKLSLSPGKYHMFIDSKLQDGNLTYGDLLIPGDSNEEIFFSTYICHPSMANDECSGPALMAELIRYVAGMRHRKYTYRFVFAPETIGAIAYMATEGHLEYLQSHMAAGFNLSCVGDERDYSIVETPYSDTLADKALKNILACRGSYSRWSYLKRGSDERQYCSPKAHLPVVCFCRSKFGEFPEYHTSADNMEFISPKGFQGSYEVLTELIDALENNERYMVTVICEPQLGKRGLFPKLSKKGEYGNVIPMTNLIAYADGRNDLFDISNLTGTPVKALLPIIDLLQSNSLIEIAKDRMC